MNGKVISTKHVSQIFQFQDNIGKLPISATFEIKGTPSVAYYTKLLKIKFFLKKKQSLESIRNKRFATSFSYNRDDIDCSNR